MTKRSNPVHIEHLEERRLLSFTLAVGANQNISAATTNQTEATVVINPTNANQIFVASNIETGDGLFVSYSNDGGSTWNRRVMASGSDGLTPACCDPSAAYDRFGNLYLTYISADLKNIKVVRSTNNGASFSTIANFRGIIDQPTITTGPSSVWLTFQLKNKVVATGASLSNTGAIGSFFSPVTIPNSGGGNFGDIAVGPGGQVVVTYQYPSGGEGPGGIYVSTDADGLGSGVFTNPIKVTTTNVGGFDYITPQSGRSVDAEAGLAFDRSGGTYNGRLYMVYTDESPDESNNTDIYMRYSTDNGKTWSARVKINKDSTTRAQFLPRIAIDQSTGYVGVSWYDSRNDGGVVGSGSTNTIVNDDAQLFATVVASTATGLSVGPNVRISAGISNAADANNGIDYGDYGALAFQGGVLRPVWADNSNSTGNNPDGKLHDFDLYTAKVTVTGTPAGANLFLPDGTYDPLFSDNGKHKGILKHLGKDEEDEGDVVDEPLIFAPLPPVEV